MGVQMLTVPFPNCVAYRSEGSSWCFSSIICRTEVIIIPPSLGCCKGSMNWGSNYSKKDVLCNDPVHTYYKTKVHKTKFALIMCDIV